MMMKACIQFKLGDTLTLKKAHPCGSFQWRVTRLGADIGLSCLNCGRKIMMSRGELEKSIKTGRYMNKYK
jgi:hypothetical protein